MSTLGGCSGLERTDFQSFSFWEDIVVQKGMILGIVTLGWCGGILRADFKQFPLWDGLVVLKLWTLKKFHF